MKKSASILSVDDERLVNEAVAKLLGAKYSVTTVPSGQQCLDTVVGVKPDLILMDVSMPGMDGYATCRKLKEDPATSTIPVIFISGLGTPEERRKGYAAGGEDYLLKPYDMDELLTKVENVLNTKLQIIRLQEDVESFQQTCDELNSELAIAASLDPLTGLNKRREMDLRISLMIAKARLNNSTHALCYLDLDQFKIINNTLGHQAGDRFIKSLTQFLKEHLTATESLATLGADDFLLLIEQCDIEQAGRRADEVRNLIEGFKFSWNQQEFRVSTSIGVIPIDSTSRSCGLLLSMADAACQRAKELGRNRVFIYLPEDDRFHSRREEMTWTSRIRHALENDLFLLYCQGIYPTDQTDRHRTEYFEVLVRMQGDNGRIIQPGLFVPPAERFDLMGEIDSWILEHTLLFIDQHREAHSSITKCSINLAGPALSDEAFLERAIQLLSRAKLPAEKICFEITETAAIHNIDHAATFIHAMKELGCSFALDDFGSGFSSYAYLRNLPVDFLKIDGVFVKNMHQDEVDHGVVKSINDIAHLMGKKTIAEFVENEQILQLSRQLGVDYVQGYHLCKPAPMADFFR
jgi:diguanylate cyclase (GGDEF)-like protein|tara:strand:- start:5747 stop:7480 length:1734 start_codon:yes stop_codon:yes gene_type:complete